MDHVHLCMLWAKASSQSKSWKEGGLLIYLGSNLNLHECLVDCDMVDGRAHMRLTSDV